MEESKTRERILKKIRQALIHKTENRFPKLDFDSEIYVPTDETLEVTFAKQFNKVNGHFVFCESELEFAESIVALSHELGWKKVFTSETKVQDILSKYDFPFLSGVGEMVQSPTSIISCEYLIARTGTVLVSSRLLSGRRTPVFPDYLLVFAYCSQLVFDFKDAISGLKERYGEQLPSMISAITGPSRTADIEKTLVQGAHGAKEIYVFLIDDLSH